MPSTTKETKNRHPCSHASCWSRWRKWSWMTHILSRRGWRVESWEFAFRARCVTTTFSTHLCRPTNGFATEGNSKSLGWDQRQWKGRRGPEHGYVLCWEPTLQMTSGFRPLLKYWSTATESRGRVMTSPAGFLLLPQKVSSKRPPPLSRMLDKSKLAYWISLEKEWT